MLIFEPKNLISISMISIKYKYRSKTQPKIRVIFFPLLFLITMNSAPKFGFCFVYVFFFSGGLWACAFFRWKSRRCFFFSSCPRLVKFDNFFGKNSRSSAGELIVSREFCISNFLLRSLGVELEVRQPNLAG